MLTVMEAIEKRRSTRKFKPDPVPDELLSQMLEAARLAPSGRNRQTWRFQIIRDQAMKERIFNEAGLPGSRHMVEAPVVIVCGAELLAFVRGSQPTPPFSEQYLGADKAKGEGWEALRLFIPDAQLYTGIAGEHIILTATALGLGTCWIHTIKFDEVARILGWPRHLVVLALLVVGYPDGDPPPRQRLPIEEIVLREGQLPR